MSVFSVNSEFIGQKFLSSFCKTQQAQRFVTHLRQLEQGRGRQSFQLDVGGFGQFKKLQQIGQSFPGITVRRFRFGRLRDAALQNLEGGIDLAFLALVGDDPEHGENILHRLEMIAPVAEDMNNANDPPALQFMKTIADVGAGDPERGGDLLRREGAGGKEKEGMDLGDGAIYPPARSHFSPMEDELLSNGREHVPIHLLFLSEQKLENIAPAVKRIFAVPTRLKGRD